MFRFPVALLAKKAPPPVSAARKKVLKRVGRTGSKSGRGASVRRRGSPSSPHALSRGAATKSTSARGAAESSAGGSPDALVRVSSEEGRTPASAAASPAAASRVMTYRLATAVSTVVVPPLANTYLESMKQILTPAVRRPQDGGLGAEDVRGQDSAPAAQMEEYYTSKKGPLFATAVIAGTNAVKQASVLIPFCHPIPIQKCSFTFRRRVVNGDGCRSALPHRVVLRKRSSVPPPAPSRPVYSVLYCFCTVATEEYKTGVEMEALTGATVAGMTLYDMLKSLPGAQEDGLALGESFVLAKRGGRNDFIKLLMSEPERAEGSRATAPAAIPPPTAAEAAAAKTSREAGPVTDKDGEVRGAAEEDGPDAEGEEDTPPALPAKVVRKVVPAAAPASATPSPLGDSGAWWRTSRQEKKLQGLFPRRRYGDNARLAPQPTSAELKGKGRRVDAVEAADAETVEDVDDDTVARAEAAARLRPRGAGPVVGKAGRAGAADVEEDEESEEVRRRKHRGGQLARKTARAPAPPPAGAEDDAAESEPRPAARRRPAPKGKRSSKAAAARARAAEVDTDEDDDDEDDDADVDTDEDERTAEGGAEVEAGEEEEDTPAPPPARSRRATTAAVSRGGGVRRKPVPKAAGRHAARHVDVEDHDDEDDGEGDRDDGEAEGEAEDGEEAEEAVPVRGRSEKLRPVKHDSWSSQTIVEDDDAGEADGAEEEAEEEEAPPPPPPKSLKKKKKMLRRS